jgi:sugar/nucleoside kinase (ribokinase family)
LLFGADGTFFSAPTYPLEEVIDPTGAGDAFAGGFLGYLSKIELQQGGRYAIDEIKRSVVHGNIIGSYVCEDFSIGRLRTLTMDDVARRYQSLVEYSHFDQNWRSR